MSLPEALRDTMTGQETFKGVPCQQKILGRSDPGHCMFSGSGTLVRI